ncbi:MAG: 4'-phosphopantetheinyl transferase superfamily protein [Cyanobacteria bacterium REEB459]|nr:4'-phosphopantetheinyl transferase superfamily protein [Cyanobacteria bacterium REEB459]
MDPVEIWEINTATVSQPDLDHLLCCLNPDEKTRLGRFIAPASWRSFLTGRGCLRHLLGHRLGRCPASLDFSYGPQGKPYLQPEVSRPPKTPILPYFNLSHCGDRLLIAISPYPVGIDVEKIRPLDNLQGLCQRCLTPTEQAYLGSQPQSQVTRLFFHFWTAKEAYLKATGKGLSLAMTTVEVLPGAESPSVYPSYRATRITTDSHWHLYQWTLKTDYVAALALPLVIGANGPPLVPYSSSVAAILAMTAQTTEVEPG